MFDGHFYAWGRTSLVLLHWLALWFWPTYVPDLLWSLWSFQAWSEPLWLRTLCNPTPARVMGKRPSTLCTWLPYARPLSFTEECGSYYMTLLLPAAHPQLVRWNQRWQAVKDPKPETLRSGSAAGHSWEQLFTSGTLFGSLWMKPAYSWE